MGTQKNKGCLDFDPTFAQAGKRHLSSDTISAERQAQMGCLDAPPTLVRAQWLRQMERPAQGNFCSRAGHLILFRVYVLRQCPSPARLIERVPGASI
jgi:hypothetical protein